MEDTVDHRWRKSSYSGNGGSDCIEVGGRGNRVLVRDTKNRTGPVLEITPGAWRRFAGQVKRSLSRDRPVLAGHSHAGDCPAGVPPHRTARHESPLMRTSCSSSSAGYGCSASLPSRLGCGGAVAAVNHLVPPGAGALSHRSSNQESPLPHQVLPCHENSAATRPFRATRKYPPKGSSSPCAPRPIRRLPRKHLGRAL